MKKFNVTLILVLCVNLLQAQNPLVKQWDYRFGGTDHDYSSSFVQTKDGGFIIGGSSLSGIGGDKTDSTWTSIDYWIIKIDSFGIKQWDKDFGGTSYDILVSLEQTSDGGYILGGWSNSGIGGDKTQAAWGNYDYWIIKTDSLGNKEWDKNFGGTMDDELTSLQQTADGGYIFGGYSISGISGDKTQITQGFYDYWIVKTDSLGNKEWDKDFGGTETDNLYSLMQTFDGGYILGGYSYSGIGGDKTQSIQGLPDYWIVKIDSLGDKQWDKDFGGTSDNKLLSLKQTNDAGYILGGCSNSGIGGDKTQNTWGNLDYWILKTDSLGNKQWDKDFGGTDVENQFGNITQTTDKGYLMVGSSRSNISGNKTENNLGIAQTWVVKTDSLGNKQWDKTLLVNGKTLFGHAIQSKEGCYEMIDYNNAPLGGNKTQNSWNNSYDYWIIKFCDTTATTLVNQIIYSQFPIAIYPNPTNTILNLFLNKADNITITNLIGEIILNKNAKGKVELDVSFLSQGIYFIRVGNEVRKFVKE